LLSFVVEKIAASTSFVIYNINAWSMHCQ